MGKIKHLEKRVEAASWGLEAQGLQVIRAQLGRPPGAGGQHLGGQLCRRLPHLGQGERDVSTLVSRLPAPFLCTVYPAQWV
jgi:hypothetical protein